MEGSIPLALAGHNTPQGGGIVGDCVGGEVGPKLGERVSLDGGVDMVGLTEGETS
jgi:hypothetical protein